MMSLFYRAIRFLKNYKVRSIIVFFIFLFLSVSLMLGINTIESINNTIDEYKSNLVINKFSIIKDPIPYADSSQFYTDSNDDGIPEYIGPMLCLKDAENIKKIDTRIIKYNTDYLSKYLTVDLDLSPAFYTWFAKNVDSIERENGEWTHEKYIEEAAFDEIVNSHSTNFHIVVDSELQHLFSRGAFELEKGRHIKKDDKYVALISEDLATINNLNVGDTFIPRQPNFYNTLEPVDKLGFFGDPFPLEIIGIFKKNFSLEASEWTIESELAENYILTDFESYKRWLHDWRQFTQSYLDFSDDEFVVDYIDFYVENPNEIDDVISRVEQSDVLDWQFYHIEKVDYDYESAVKPLNSLSSMVFFFVSIILGGCTAVLFLLINMSEKARKRETYIYRSLGIYRSSITLQRVIEMIILSVTAFVVAILVGNLLVIPFGEYTSKYVNNNAADTKEFEAYYDENGDFIVDKKEKIDLKLENQIEFNEFIITFVVIEGVVLSATLIARKGNKDTLILK